MDAVLDVWDSEAERELFAETFEPLEDGFFSAAEDLRTALHTIGERGKREHEAFFGAGFRERLARRVDTLARTRLDYLQRLASIAATGVNDARRLREVGTLTAAARARVSSTRPPGWRPRRDRATPRWPPRAKTRSTSCTR